MEERIYLIKNKKEEEFLRKKTFPCAFDSRVFTSAGKELATKDLGALLMRMKTLMHDANGIGLSANQVGLPYRFFVAKIPTSQGSSKLYSIFNPEIEKLGDEEVLLEEGCLSIPGVWGDVPRRTQIWIRGLDKMGKPVRIKAWGLLAHVFQHEIDHLNGTLFIDKAKKLYKNTTHEDAKHKK